MNMKLLSMKKIQEIRFDSLQFDKNIHVMIQFNDNNLKILKKSK